MPNPVQKFLVKFEGDILLHQFSLGAGTEKVKHTFCALDFRISDLKPPTQSGEKENQGDPNSLDASIKPDEDDGHQKHKEEQ